MNKRNGERRDRTISDENILYDKNAILDLYLKNLDYLPNLDSHNDRSMPFAVTKYIRGPVSLPKLFAAGKTDAPDFPYWNLLRQKWLLSAQPRRLSQVRLFHKRDQDSMTNGYMGKRSRTMTSIEPDKRSLFHLLSLLRRRRDHESNGSNVSIRYPYENEIPYETPKCYLNNVSC